MLFLLFLPALAGLCFEFDGETEKYRSVLRLESSAVLKYKGEYEAF